MSERKRMSAAARRVQLLDLARDIVSTAGFSALTIDELARRAQVTRTLVYHQFGDLPGLVQALVDRESGIAVSGMRALEFRADDDLDGVIDRLGHGILDYLDAEPTSWRIILDPPEGSPSQLRQRIEEGRSFARSIASKRLSRATGTEVPADGLSMRIMLAALEEIARLRLNDPQNYPPEVVLPYFRSILRWSVQASDETAPID